MCRKIVVTGGKGGSGKTTVTANLGRALAHKGVRVALVDLDVGLNNLDVVMNISHNVVFDLVDVIEGRSRVNQALIQDEEEPTLYVMPSGHRAQRQISIDAVRKVINRLEDCFDYIFMDCPAGIDSGFRRAVSCADEAIIVVTPHLSGVHDAVKTAEALNEYDLIEVGVVVNRVRGDLVKCGEMPSPFEIFSLIDRHALGIIPETDQVNCHGSAYGVNMRPFYMLADNVVNGKQAMWDCVAPYNGLFGKLRSKLRRNA